MKALLIVPVVVAAVALVAAPAEAAKKRKSATTVPHAAVVKSDPHFVRANNGEVLGRDPDLFIRLMLLRQGNPRDQSGM